MINVWLDHIRTYGNKNICYKTADKINNNLPWILKLVKETWKFEYITFEILNVWGEFTILKKHKKSITFLLLVLIRIFFFQPATGVKLLFGIFYVSTIVMKSLGLVLNATLHFGGETGATGTNLIMVVTYLTLLTHGQKIWQSHVRDERMGMNLGGCVLTGFIHAAWN